LRKDLAKDLAKAAINGFKKSAPGLKKMKLKEIIELISKKYARKTTRSSARLAVFCEKI
jgi:hypothetical protein